MSLPSSRCLGRMPIPQLSEGRRVGLGVGDPEGVGVGSLGLDHLLEVFGVGGGGLGVDVDPVGEQHVGGGEGGAVVPLDPVAQVEGDGQVVGGDLPRFGQLPFELEVLVVAHQAVVDQAVDVGGGRIGGEDRQQGARLADGPLDEGVAVGRRGRLPLGRDRRFVPVAASGNQQEHN